MFCTLSEPLGKCSGKSTITHTYSHNGSNANIWVGPCKGLLVSFFITHKLAYLWFQP